MVDTSLQYLGTVSCAHRCLLTMLTNQYLRGTETQQRRLVLGDSSNRNFTNKQWGSRERFEGMDVHIFYLDAADTSAQRLSIAVLFANLLLLGVTRGTVSGEWRWSGKLISLSALMLCADLLYRNRDIPHIQ